MGLVLALAVAAITTATVWIAGARIWWFPPPITALGRMYDQHFVFTAALVGFFFVLGQALLIYVVLQGKNRRRELGRRWIPAVMGVMVLRFLRMTAI